MIGYAYDDGGRAAAGFRGNTGDCVVRAIAIITRTAYIDAYRRMAASMKRAGYTATGNAYRQKRMPGFRPSLSPLKVQELVIASYGLHRLKRPRATRPTYTEAHALHGNCLVRTVKHISPIIDGNLRDIVDSRTYDGRIYGGTANDQRKAQSLWTLFDLSGCSIMTPEFDPVRLIPPPVKTKF